jgi:hypothetical protein
MRTTPVVATGVWLVAAACSNHISYPNGDSGMAGSQGAVTALAVSPAQATVMLAAAGSGFAASQAFTATATYADGSTSDVTSQVTWEASDPTVTFTAADAAFAAAGVYTVQAFDGDIAGSAQVSAVLDAVGFAPGFTGSAGLLDGTPIGTEVPSIAYPIAGALVPVNVAPIEVHAQKSDPSQSIARIELTSGTLLDYKYYAPCAPSPNPTTFPNACIVDITGTFATQLAGVSETADVNVTVRLAAADGSMLGESAPVALAWAKTALTGGLYYWTTAGSGDTTFNTAIARYNFDGDASAPIIYLSSNDAPTVPNGQPQCIGCHALSPMGDKVSFSLGGSLPGYFSLYDAATVSATATNFSNEFAIMSTFSPDSSREITGSYGTLTLRQADASLAADGSGLLADQIDEKLSHPAWSSSGKLFACVSWVPTQANIAAGQVTGDMVQGAQIWVTPSDGTELTGSASLLVPRGSGVSNYYPSISDDDNFVVFDQSSCSGPANNPSSWGSGACDGYNDISARLFVIPSTGGTPVALANANGGDAPLTTNSWPRWSPDHGTFRGKTLYWVAFSSRRAFGLSLPSGAGSDATKPQLWFAAIAIDPTAPLTADPSFAPFWLPGQDPDLAGPRGNHTPAWTAKAVLIQ